MNELRNVCELKRLKNELRDANEKYDNELWATNLKMAFMCSYSGCLLLALTLPHYMALFGAGSVMFGGGWVAGLLGACVYIGMRGSVELPIHIVKSCFEAHNRTQF
jgi:hypothetical protein